MNLAQEELARLDQTGVDEANLAKLQREAIETNEAFVEAQAAIEPIRLLRRDAETLVTKMRTNADMARSTVTALTAELSGLNSALSMVSSAVPEPVLDLVSVQPEFEAAFAAALGSDATASSSVTGPIRWSELPPLDLRAPNGTIPLMEKVKVPAALDRVMAGIGIAPADKAAELHAGLRQGQAIVTADGSLFRWDGLVRMASTRAADPVTATLAARNRIADLTGQLIEAKTVAEMAENSLLARQADADARMAQERAALDLVGTSLRKSQEADRALASFRTAAEQVANRRQQACAAVERTTAAAQEATETCASLQGEVARLPDLEAVCAAQDAAQKALNTERAKLGAAAARTHEARQMVERTMSRLASISDEHLSWQTRARTRDSRRAEIAARIEAAIAILQSFDDRPTAIEAQLRGLQDRIDDAEQLCRVRTNAVINGETELTEHRREARLAEQALATTREDRARAETQREAASNAVRETNAQIVARLHISVDELFQTLGDQNAIRRDQVEQRLAGYVREREAIGPVNLRAELELEEAAAEISRITADRTDLENAIARMRQAIATLNREARERLSAAFQIVRVHFKRLFTTLFGGGEADLALTNLEDPLEAGLEIYASPPGKKLQILSLLSGGEQALTALALLFAMFLATPAPVCVLDEVDAPLDDANVTRFCDLLDEISAQTGTRFLVITHHRVTMARMDRLYGVTMAERGVSMLVSVDLRLAESLAGSAEARELPLQAIAGGR